TGLRILEEFSDKRNTTSANLTKKWESPFLSSGSSNSDVSIILQVISHDKGMVEAVGPGPALGTGGGYGDRRHMSSNGNSYRGSAWSRRGKFEKTR
ncbi:MAG: hypothetical protein WBE34_04235, partial [Candidatus Nitrosopolaris sp.]